MADLMEFFNYWAEAVGFSERRMVVEFGSPDIILAVSVGGKHPVVWKQRILRHEIEHYLAPRETAAGFARGAKKQLREFISNAAQGAPA